MTSNQNSQTLAGQPKRTSFSGFPGGSATMFLDRSKAGIRGSTPDSEALASSDDEQDHHHRLHQVTSNPGPVPARRPSWLTDTQQAQTRKGSFGANGAFAPASPSSAAPNDQTLWGGNVGSSTASTLGRGHSTSTSFPWGSTIWNSDSQKGPPQRLTEVLPSPTSMVPPGSAGLHSEESMQSPHGQDTPADSAIPFAIPLQPTLKTYRSQSYSVGQLDPESSVITPPTYAGYTTYGRQRNGPAPYTNLQHRPSRPSMLGDLSHDPSLLGQLREVEDDESSNGSESGVHLSTTQRTIEQLAKENAMLRQQAADQLGRETTRTRSRTTTNNSNTSKATRSSNQSYQQRVRENAPEASDYALYEIDEPDLSQLYKFPGLSGRRSSEYTTKTSTQYAIPGIPENRTLESVKKGHWQSSLGFGGIGEPPQSRRHSFADIPTRQNSIGSAGESQNGQVTADASRSNGRLGSPGGYGDGLIRPSQGDSMSYFSQADPSLRNAEAHRSPLTPTSMHQAYMQTQYGRPQHLNHTQTRPNQLLYMVTFKAQRADVFYVQEGTGLQVRKGDLVIVEADRGADLGTVASESVPFSEAKELKDKYMQEHFQWLMVFSRHGQDGTVAGPNPNGQPSTSNSAIGGMGGSPNQTGAQDLPSCELKPKMIKRLAQSHEIQTLRDKEGNEAKAKRVCQQKVVEHRLNMEILEAEFQMDWKKLTFYYFADEYINFNSLVTDLFKIYKTRIWMSAINPASFQTPVGGLQIPGVVGPNAFGADVDQLSSRRQPRQIPNSAVSTGPTQTALGVYDQTWVAAQEGNVISGMAFLQHYAQPFPPHDLDLRQLDQYSLEYRQGLPQALGLQPTFTSPNYNAPNLHHSPSCTSRPDSSNGGPQPSQIFGRDWNQAMQGLSLGPPSTTLSSRLHP